MTVIIAMLIGGGSLVVIALIFGWLNMNTPLQTRIPLPALLLGGSLICLALGGTFL